MSGDRVSATNRRADSFTENQEDIVTPDNTVVEFEVGHPVPATRGDALAVSDVRATRSDGFVSVFGMVTVLHSDGCAATFVPQSARQLRDLAAACLRTADVVDGGSGLQ